MLIIAHIKKDFTKLIFPLSDKEFREDGMVSNISNVNVFSYSSIAGSSGKVKVPVQPHLVIYSQLEHISGVAAQQNQRGININKIQILNTLIDRLTSAKQNPTPSAIEDVSDIKQIDALIKNLSDQVQLAVSAAESTIFSVPTIPAQTGAVFSVAV